MIKAESAGKDRSFPQAQPYTVSVLEEIGLILIAIAELLSRGPHCTNISCGDPWLDGIDRRTDPLRGLFIGLDLAFIGFATYECAIVTGMVAIEGVH